MISVFILGMTDALLIQERVWFFTFQLLGMRE